jgi:PhzF family phenazine biosynthesis protein
MATHAFHTRVFAPTFGYLEDPATGSASAALGYYWRDEGLWDGQPIVLEQGTNKEHPNEIRLTTKGDAEGTVVLFGGAAVPRIDGDYLLWG